MSNDALREKYEALADELEHVTIRALRCDAELAAAKEREAESARQWLAMSAELAAARARVTKHERLLERLTRMLVALRDNARGTNVESDADAVLGVLELHRPSRDEGSS